MLYFARGLIPTVCQTDNQVMDEADWYGDGQACLARDCTAGIQGHYVPEHAIFS